MKSRETLGELFQSVYKTGIGAEIGCEQGYNAKSIFKYWQGSMFCIDIWQDKKGFENDFINNTKGLDIMKVKGDSAECANLIADEYLDFVYIDADHSYDGVKRDFEEWFSKVRKGGIVSGHDYAPLSHPNDCDGVRQFIDEYMANNPNVKMNFTTDDFYVGEREDLKGMEFQTWWFIKD